MISCMSHASHSKLSKTLPPALCVTTFGHCHGAHISTYGPQLTQLPCERSRCTSCDRNVEEQALAQVCCKLLLIIDICMRLPMCDNALKMICNYGKCKC